MIKLRLQRKGRKKRPFYHIVVADSRSPRDGRIIERVGRFDNVSEKKELTFDEERIIHWLKIGAQPSDTVRNLLKSKGILYKLHLMRWGKSDEEIEAALEEWRKQREAKETSDEKISRKEREKELLKAEEKEYKKQLEQKAAEAAAALEKKEKADQDVAEQEKMEVEQETAETEATDVKEDEVKAEAEAEEKTEPEAAVESEQPAEKQEAETTADISDKEEEKVKAAEISEPEKETAEETAEVVEDVAEEAPKTEKDEKKTDVKTEEPAEKKPAAEKKEASVSSVDMNAAEAIDYIKNNSIDQLEGFVGKNEERVTVLRAWESKQSEK
ncbi:MAG: 30S ribosomal protein S16 [Balneolaceae bacterium]